MNEKSSIFVTGSTGFLGSHFIYRLIQTQSEPNVAALVRGESLEVATDRLHGTLRRVAESYCETIDESLLARRIHVVIGDVAQPHCGASSAFVLASQNQIREFWHFAASLNFEEAQAAEIELMNVTGTGHALELATLLRCRQFNYVSTAYTAGQRQGVIDETTLPAVGDVYNNAYERTKATAERLVASSCEQAGMQFAIFRPSIVIGPRTTKRTGGSSTGIYGFARELSRLASTLNQVERIVVRGEPDLPINLVPVDEVAREMLAIRASEYAEGPIHHLTSSRAVPLAEGLRIACEATGVRPFEVVSGHNAVQPIERLLARRLEFYRSYFLFPKSFERRRPDNGGVSGQELRSFLLQSLAEARGQTSAKLMKRKRFGTTDGLALAGYETGEAVRGTVVLVNAVGMPVEFFLPMARHLRRNYRVLTWESRGVPGCQDAFLPGHARMEAHGEDLSSLLQSSGVKGPVALVGWCSGAHVVHRYAREHPERVGAIVMMNGAFDFAGAPITSYQEHTRTVMSRIAKGRQYAEFYCKTLYGRGSDSTETRQVNALLDGVDPALIPMTSLPFQSVESLYRYALLIQSCITDGEEPYAGQVATPTLLLACERDKVAHHSGSVAFAERFESAQLQVLETGDHYSFYNDEQVWHMVDDFLSAAMAQDASERKPSARLASS